MPLINYATREVEFKIVYYGAAFSGKTTSLKAILSLLKADSPSLTPLQLGPDRTLFFECTPDVAGLVEGFTGRVRVWTVPGEPHLNAPRQLVLRDVDGVVFVVDPQWSRVRDNLSALDNLEQNLRRLQIDPDDVPLVLQFNKSDLPNPVRRDYLEFLLNPTGKPRHPSFDTCAAEADNVIPCLERLVELAVEKFGRNHARQTLA